MTIEFVAAYTKDPNWMMALSTLLVTLAVLYGFVKLARAPCASGRQRTPNDT